MQAPDYTQPLALGSNSLTWRTPPLSQIVGCALPSRPGRSSRPACAGADRVASCRSDPRAPAHSPGDGPLHPGGKPQHAPRVAAGAGPASPAQRRPPRPLPGGLEFSAHSGGRLHLRPRASRHGDAQVGQAPLPQRPQAALRAPSRRWSGRGRTSPPAGRSGSSPRGRSTATRRGCCADGAARRGCRSRWALRSCRWASAFRTTIRRIPSLGTRRWRSTSASPSCHQARRSGWPRRSP